MSDCTCDVCATAAASGRVPPPLTLTCFERHAGAERMKKWKTSVRAADGSGLALGPWLEKAMAAAAAAAAEGAANADQKQEQEQEQAHAMQQQQEEDASASLEVHVDMSLDADVAYTAGPGPTHPAPSQAGPAPSSAAPATQVDKPLSGQAHMHNAPPPDQPPVAQAVQEDVLQVPVVQAVQTVQVVSAQQLEQLRLARELERAERRAAAAVAREQAAAAAAAEAKAWAQEQAEAQLWRVNHARNLLRELLQQAVEKQRSMPVAMAMPMPACTVSVAGQLSSSVARTQVLAVEAAEFAPILQSAAVVPTSTSLLVAVLEDEQAQTVHNLSEPAAELLEHDVYPVGGISEASAPSLIVAATLASGQQEKAGRGTRIESASPLAECMVDDELHFDPVYDLEEPEEGGESQQECREAGDDAEVTAAAAAAAAVAAEALGLTGMAGISVDGDAAQPSIFR